MERRRRIRTINLDEWSSAGERACIALAHPQPSRRGVLRDHRQPGKGPAARDRRSVDAGLRRVGESEGRLDESSRRHRDRIAVRHRAGLGGDARVSVGDACALRNRASDRRRRDAEDVGRLGVAGTKARDDRERHARCEHARLNRSANRTANGSVAHRTSPANATLPCARRAPTGKPNNDSQSDEHAANDVESFAAKAHLICDGVSFVQLSTNRSPRDATNAVRCWARSWSGTSPSRSSAARSRS